MSSQEIYSQDYRHVDGLIWAVPAWSTAVFSLSMTSAALVISNIANIQNNLPINPIKLLSLFLITIFFVLMLLKNVFLRFRVNQRHIPQLNRSNAPSAWFLIRGQTALLLLLFIETSTTLCFAMITLGVNTSWAIISALLFLFIGFIYVEKKIEKIPVNYISNEEKNETS